MANSELKLTGNFEGGKNYLLKGETLNQWMAALLADRVIPGPGLLESQTPQGRFLKLAGAEPTTAVAAGCTRLKASLVNISETETPDYVVRISDGLLSNETPKIGTTAINADPAPEIAVDEGDDIYLVADWEPESRTVGTGTGARHFLASGGTPKNVRFEKIGGSDPTPQNVAPTVNDTSGVKTDGLVYIKWATFLRINENDNPVFTAYRCGNLFIKFCEPANFMVYFEVNDVFQFDVGPAVDAYLDEQNGGGF